MGFFIGGERHAGPTPLFERRMIELANRWVFTTTPGRYEIRRVVCCHPATMFDLSSLTIFIN